jgi:hypothetical protein
MVEYKEKWIWDNIMSIYLNKGENYSVNTKSIFIKSHDNYFIVKFKESDMRYEFKISIEHSFFKDTQYTFNSTVLFSNKEQEINCFIEKLKPIFRDYKLEELI